MVDKVILIVSYLAAGGFIALVFKTFFRSKAESDSAIVLLVKQLQDNVNANNSKIISLEADLHRWREKYYLELEEKNKLSDELRQVRIQLQKFNAKNPE